MKKWISAAVLLLCILVAVSAGVTVLIRQNEQPSEPAAQQEIRTSSGSAPARSEETPSEPAGPQVVIDGQPMQTVSALRGDTVMVSAEEFTDRMQADYAYSPDSGTLTLTWNDRTAELTVGADMAVLNGETVSVEAPYVIDDTVMIPAAVIAEAFAADATVDRDTLFLTPYAGEWEVLSGYAVPTLMYHAVSDDTWGTAELFVRPSEMERQLQYLTEHGYTTITFEDLYRIDEIEKPVLLTFDDGYDDNYEILFPLLKKYNCKATIFIITRSYEKGGDPSATHKMTKKQMKELSDSGLVSIQSHTRTHRRLGELSADEQEAELRRSRLQLLRCTGKLPFVLCYPEGSYNRDTLALAPDFYRFGLKMTGGLYRTSDNPLLVNRYYISRNTTLSTFASYVSHSD